MIRMSRLVVYTWFALLFSCNLSQRVSLAQGALVQQQVKLNRLDAGTVQFYSWFAETVVKLSEKRDIDGAGRVARLMEISWDHDSDRFEDQVWSKVDQASDELVQPAEWGSTLNHNPRHVPDLAKIKAAYDKYVAVLKAESTAPK
jgi:hypothetical protein